MPFLQIPVLVTPHARKEYLTRLTIQLITMVNGIFLAPVFMGYWVGFYDAQPFPYFLGLQFISIVGWYLCRHGHWRWANSWPVIFFFLLGVYGSWGIGFSTIYIVFYVLAFILAGVLIDGWALLITVLGSLAAHLSMAVFIHNENLRALIPNVIVLTAAFTGMALLQWLFTLIIDHAFAQGYCDPLTGLFNRGYFDGTVKLMEKSRHYPISILMADIDELKKVNDEYGHACGDELIVRAAQCLQSICRADDVLCRIGGDEFVALFPHTSEKVIGQIAERLTQQVSRENQTASGTPLQLAIGTATALHKHRLLQTLKQADARMYDQKRAHAHNRQVRP